MNITEKRPKLLILGYARHGKDSVAEIKYTVRTPGARDRGARRIVCGGETPVRPVACYYTADHYASFRVIVTPQN